MPRPNLVYITTHDTGRHTQPHGHAVDTPRLMAFAKESTLFRNNHCCGPTCSPSRAAMLTGQHVHTSGMVGLQHQGFSLANPERHLANFLAKNGYDTALFGHQHEAKTPGEIGYARAFTADSPPWWNNLNRDPAYWDHENARAAAAFLGEKHDKPFYMALGMYHTHREFCEPADADINPDYITLPPQIPDTAENRRDFAGFLTSARRADECVGIVLDALERNGLLDNTVVFFTTDHGIAYPWTKCNLYDAGTGTTLMMRYPGNPSRGRALDALTSHLDVFPTLCELLGLEKPDWLQGVSLVPLFNRERDEVRDHLFTQVIYHAAYEPQLAVRTHRHKYIRRFDLTHPYTALPNIDHSPFFHRLMENGLAEKWIDEHQFYDLLFDPMERDNLTHDINYWHLEGELRDLLEKWMRDTDHPLLKGPVPLPKGAGCTRPTCPKPGGFTPEDRITAE